MRGAVQIVLIAVAAILIGCGAEDQKRAELAPPAVEQEKDHPAKERARMQRPPSPPAY